MLHYPDTAVQRRQEEVKAALLMSLHSFLYANNFLEPGYFVITVNISVFALEAKSMEELLLTQVEAGSGFHLINLPA